MKRQAGQYSVVSSELPSDSLTASVLGGPRSVSLMSRSRWNPRIAGRGSQCCGVMLSLAVEHAGE